MQLIIAVISAAASAPRTSLPDSYLERVAAALEAARADLTAMQPAAEEAAQRLASGGKFWIAGQPSMVSELSGRAGGFMMLRPLAENTPGPPDVVLFFQDGAAQAPENHGALLVCFGDPPSDGAPVFPNYARECGISPTLANAIPGWLFTGELIAALTRCGKMPVIYESIGAYGGNARITQYKNGDIPFHADLSAPPVAPGYIGNQYIDRVAAMLRRIEREHHDDLLRAGQWAKDTQVQGKQLFMYSMGHLFPDEVGKTDIGRLFHSAVWNAGFRSQPTPNDVYVPGDLAVLIGYQHPPDVLLRRARPAGARVVYVTVRHDRDFTRDPDVIWIDPMWDWPDACVPLEGYDVPLLAASGIVNGAIAWEIYRLSCIPGLSGTNLSKSGNRHEP